jgi:hypothetical protein
MTREEFIDPAKLRSAERAAVDSLFGPTACLAKAGWRLMLAIGGVWSCNPRKSPEVAKRWGREAYESKEVDVMVIIAPDGQWHAWAVGMSRRECHRMRWHHREEVGSE